MSGCPLRGGGGPAAAAGDSRYSALSLGPGIFIVLAALPALRVEVNGEVPCDLTTRLRPAVAEQRLEVDDGAAHRLVVARVSTALVVRLVDGSGRELGWRTLRPSPRDCAVLPRTIVLLARTWLVAKFPEAERAARASESSAVDGGETAGRVPRASGAETRAGVARDGESVAVHAHEGETRFADTRGMDGGAERSRGPAGPDRIAEPRSAGVPNERAADTRAADARGADAREADTRRAESRPPDAPPALPPTATAAAPTAEAPPRAPDARTTAPSPASPPPTTTETSPSPAGVTPRFHVAALGGIALDLARPAAHLTAIIEWALLESWGIALDFAADTPRTVSATPGTLTLQHYAVGLSARRHLVSNLHATLGARLFLMPAATTGFSPDAGTLLVSGGFFATLDWRQPIYERLFLIARIGGQARIRWEVLEVPGTDARLVLPAWSFFVQAGLGLKL